VVTVSEGDTGCGNCALGDCTWAVVGKILAVGVDKGKHGCSMEVGPWERWGQVLVRVEGMVVVGDSLEGAEVQIYHQEVHYYEEVVGQYQEKEEEHYQEGVEGQRQVVYARCLGEVRAQWLVEVVEVSEQGRREEGDLEKQSLWRWHEEEEGEE
jgi:hypothetical protein